MGDPCHAPLQPVRLRTRTFGVHLHRLMTDDKHIPKVVSMLSEYLLEHGYRCSNLLHKKTDPETYCAVLPWAPFPCAFLALFLSRTTSLPPSPQPARVQVVRGPGRLSDPPPGRGVCLGALRKAAPGPAGTSGALLSVPRRGPAGGSAPGSRFFLSLSLIGALSFSLALAHPLFPSTFFCLSLSLGAQPRPRF